MLRLLIAASGSKANAAVVEFGGRLVLFDCGTTYKALSGALCRFGLDIGALDAVFITHSHSDHTKGLLTLKKHTDAPVYSAVDIDGCQKLTGDIEISGMKISFFDCLHDVDCVGYKIKADGKTLCIATDTGVVTDAMLESLVGCDTVMLESNHDTDMLRFGPYPQTLKNRIASERGHLSNADCAKALTHLAANGTKQAVLCHLSETNNTPLVARKTALDALGRYGFDKTMSVTVADANVQIEI